MKNHDFTPKNHIFSNCGGRRENFWGISCEKSRFYAKKSFFPIAEGGAKIFGVFNSCEKSRFYANKSYFFQFKGGGGGGGGGAPGAPPPGSAPGVHELDPWYIWFVTYTMDLTN